MNDKSMDLDVATPTQVAQVLRAAADKFNESMGELQSAWQDEQAGRVWGEFAKILNRAADQADKACGKYFK